MAAPTAAQGKKDTKAAAKDAEAAKAEATETNGAGDEDAAKAAAEQEKVNERERKAAEKAEAEKKVRDEKIKNGDLIVGDGFEYEAATKDTKVTGQVQQIVANLQESGAPMVFATVVSDVGAKYPEDLIPAMHALEFVGLVRRFDAKSTAEGAGNRRQTAYQWIGDAPAAA